MTRKNDDNEKVDSSRVSMTLSAIEEGLSAISDREYQLRVWYRTEGPEVDWYEERMLTFGTGIECLETLLRKGQTSLTPSQVKAILRVFVMDCHFSGILRLEDVPEDWSEEQLHIINHPYWQKVQKQAAYALSLLKKDEKGSDTPLRAYGSLATRTASRRPRLEGRFAEKMRVFSERRLREEQWTKLDDFWNSVKSFYRVFDQYWDGRGKLSNGWLYEAMMAFHHTLDEFCSSYENDHVVTLKQIVSDPRFFDIEKKAQDFLKLDPRKTGGRGHH